MSIIFFCFGYLILSFSYFLRERLKKLLGDQKKKEKRQKNELARCEKSCKIVVAKKDYLLSALATKFWLCQFGAIQYEWTRHRIITLPAYQRTNRPKCAWTWTNKLLIRFVHFSFSHFLLLLLLVLDSCSSVQSLCVQRFVAIKKNFFSQNDVHRTSCFILGTFCTIFNHLIANRLLYFTFFFINFSCFILCSLWFCLIFFFHFHLLLLFYVLWSGIVRSIESIIIENNHRRFNRKRKT